MATPTLVTVHGRLADLVDGAAGTVVFRCYRTLTNAPDILPPFEAVAVADSLGEFTIALPATNDPAWVPQGWAYSVHVQAGGGARGSLQLDYQTTSVELADLLQIDGIAGDGVTYATLAQLAEHTAAADPHPQYALESALGDAAALDVGTTTSTVAAGNDARITTAQAAVRTRPARPGLLPVTHFQAGHGWTFDGNQAGTSNTDDTSTWARGTQSLKMVTAGTSTWTLVRSNGAPTLDATGKDLEVWVKTGSADDAGVIYAYAGDSGLANHWVWEISQAAWNAAGMNVLPDGVWTVLTLSFANAVVNGSPTRTAITDWGFAVQDANAAATVWFGGLDLAPARTDYPNGLVSICFDDTFGAQYTLARPALDTYSYAATLFPIIDRVDTSTYLTTTQIRSLQDDHGWEVGVHASTTAAHDGYALLDAAAIRADFDACTAWMATAGLAFQGSYAYPLGQFTGGQADDLPPGVSARTITNWHSFNTLPAARPLRLWSASGIGGSGGLAVADIIASGGLLDRTVDGKAWLILTIHDVVSGASAGVNECSAADLATLLAAIDTRGMTVLPVGAVMRTAAALGA